MSGGAGNGGERRREVTRGEQRHAVTPAVDDGVERRCAVAERPDHVERQEPHVGVEARGACRLEPVLYLAELVGVDRGGLPIGGEQVQVARDEREQIDGGRAGQRRGARLDDFERAHHQEATNRVIGVGHERLPENDLSRVRPRGNAHRAEGRRDEDIERREPHRGRQLADFGPHPTGLPGHRERA